MIAEGFGLLAAGMGMVFAFLILMVLVMMASTRLLRRFPALSRAESPGSSAVQDEPADTDDDKLAEIAAAVAAAKDRSRS